MGSGLRFILFGSLSLVLCEDHRMASGDMDSV